MAVKWVSYPILIGWPRRLRDGVGESSLSEKEARNFAKTRVPWRVSLSLSIPTCKQLYRGTSDCCCWNHQELPLCIDDQGLEETISIMKEGTVRDMHQLHITRVIGTDVTWRDVVLNFQVSLFVNWIETPATADYLGLVANPLASLKYTNIYKKYNIWQYLVTNAYSHGVNYILLIFCLVPWHNALRRMWGRESCNLGLKTILLFPSQSAYLMCTYGSLTSCMATELAVFGCSSSPYSSGKGGSSGPCSTILAPAFLDNLFNM